MMQKKPKKLGRRLSREQLEILWRLLSRMALFQSGNSGRPSQIKILFNCELGYLQSPSLLVSNLLECWISFSLAAAVKSHTWLPFARDGENVKALFLVSFLILLKYCLLLSWAVLIFKSWIRSGTAHWIPNPSTIEGICLAFSKGFQSSTIYCFA